MLVTRLVLLVFFWKMVANGEKLLNLRIFQVVCSIRWAVNSHFDTKCCLVIDITVCTVVQNCCKGDSPCQWKTVIFTPSEIKNV